MRFVWKKIKDLDNFPEKGDEAQTILDSLDDKITRCMRCATKKSGRMQSEWKTWSPEIWTHGLICKYWRLQKQWHTTGREYEDQLAGIVNTFSDDDDINLPAFWTDFDTAKKNKEMADKKLVEVQKNAGPTRDKFLETCAKEWEETRGGECAAIVRGI